MYKKYVATALVVLVLASPTAALAAPDDTEEHLFGSSVNTRLDSGDMSKEELSGLIQESNKSAKGNDNRTEELKRKIEREGEESYKEVMEYKPDNEIRNRVISANNPDELKLYGYSVDSDTGLPVPNRGAGGGFAVSLRPTGQVFGNWTKYENEAKRPHTKEEAIQYLLSLEGTVYSQSNRMGSGMYDCSSMVDRVTAYFLGRAPNGMTTFTMPSDPRFTQIPLSEVKPYDVLWLPSHVEFYVGGNDTFGAHSWSQPNGLARGNYTWTKWARAYRVNGW